MVQTILQFQKVTFITKFFDYIHPNTYPVTSNNSNTRSITYLCLLFLKKIQIIQSYSYGLANQTPDVETNIDPPVGKCFTQTQSYGSRRLRQILREAKGGSFTKVGDFLDEEQSPSRTKHASKSSR